MDILCYNNNLFNIKSKLNNNYYYKGLKIYYIDNNKIKKGIISSIEDGKYFASPFIFRNKKIEVFPGISCFTTKILAEYVLNLLQGIDKQ